MIELLAALENAGISRLRDGDKEISGACPLHQARTGKPDTNPSWSINKKNFLHHCFSCGYSGTLTQLLTDVTGSAPVDLEIELAEQGVLKQWADLRREPTAAVDTAVSTLTEWTLWNKLKSVPEKFRLRRNLQTDALNYFGVRFNPVTKQVVMPIRTPQGDILGAQYRRATGVLTLPKTTPKSTTLFGLSHMSQFDYTVVVESPLDAVRLFGVGVSSVSSLGAWLSREQMRLLARNFTTVYLALDDDKAGHDGAEIARKGISRYGTAVVDWDYTGLVDVDGDKAKDPGDVADDDSLLASWERTRRLGW